MISSGRRRLPPIRALITLCCAFTARLTSCLPGLCNFRSCYTAPGRTTSCFQFFPLIAYTWKEAKEKCEEKGAHLASHDDYEEWLWTKQELDGIAMGNLPKACKGDMSKMSKSVWWIGGYFDADGSKTWKWTGSEEEIQNAKGFAAKGKNNRWNHWKGEWATDHPDKRDPKATCLTLSFGPAPYNWFSRQCYYNLPFICEWKQKNRNNVCDLPVVWGSCDDEIERFYYDSKLKTCKKFTYKGCNGGPNMFNSQEDCQNKCGNGLSKKASETCDLRKEDGAFVVTGSKDSAPLNSALTLRCPPGFKMMKRDGETYVATPELEVKCVVGGVWDPALPLCLPDCSVFKGGFEDSKIVFDEFWKRFWHHRTAFHGEEVGRRNEILRTCYLFDDSAKLNFRVARAKCRKHGAVLATGPDRLEMDMLNSVASSIYWRGRMQYVHNGRSVNTIDQNKADYDTWWIGGTTRDQIDGIDGLAVGPKEFFEPLNQLNSDKREKYFSICERSVPALTTGELKRLIGEMEEIPGIDDVFDPSRVDDDDIDDAVDEEGVEKMRKIIDAFDRSDKPTTDDVEEEKKRKEKIEILRKLVAAKDAECCAILQPLFSAQVQRRRKLLTAAVARSVIAAAMKSAEAAKCYAESSCMREAKRAEKEIDDSESSGSGGVSGSSSSSSGSAPDCTDPAAVSADSRGECSAGDKIAAKKKVEEAVKDYLKNFVEAKDGMYSKDGTGFENIYNAEKKKKFLKDKPLGRAVEWLISTKPLIKELIDENKLEKEKVEEFEEFVLKESVEEQKRIMKAFLKKNAKDSPDPYELQELVDEYKTASFYGGSAIIYLDNLLKKAIEKNPKASRGKGKAGGSLSNVEEFLEKCDVIGKMVEKCKNFLKNKSKKIIEVDIKEVEEVRKEFRRGNVIISQLCKERGNEHCEDSKVSGQNVKHDMDVRLTLKSILKFGLDTADLKMVKKVVNSPYLEAASKMGWDNRGRIQDAEAEVDVAESEGEYLGEPTLDLKEFDAVKCEAAFEENTQNIAKAIKCLQGALAGMIGNEDQVKEWMKPTAEGWPIRLQLMVGAAVKELKKGLKGDSKTKTKALEEAFKKGFPRTDSKEGRRLVTYVDRFSCAVSLLETVKTQLIDAQVYKKHVNLNALNEWIDQLKKSDRSALDGENVELTCDDGNLYEPVDAAVRCSKGVVDWKRSLTCARAECAKPTLAANVEFLDFEDKNLHTRWNEDSISEGVLKVKVTEEFFAPDPPGVFDEKEKLWKYTCEKRKTWSPSLLGSAASPSIGKKRPTCPELTPPDGPVYENFLWNDGGEVDLVAGVIIHPTCQTANGYETIIKPEELYCHIDGTWRLDKNTKWDEKIECQFKGFCNLPHKLNKKDKYECLDNAEEDCNDSDFGLQVPQRAHIYDMECDGTHGLSTTLNEIKKKARIKEEVQHWCTKADEEGEKGIWIAKEGQYDDGRIVPMPTLETIGNDPSEFFCQAICPEGFEPLASLFMVNTNKECCNRQSPTYGCFKAMRNKFKYSEAEDLCQEDGARLPTEKEVRQICHAKLASKFCKGLNKDQKDTTKLVGGYWISKTGGKERFVGYERKRGPASLKPDCYLTEDEFEKVQNLYIHEEDNGEHKVVCVADFLDEPRIKFWNEVNRLSEKCEKEGFWHGENQGQKWNKCADENDKQCCLTKEQWYISKCNEALCKDPLRMYKANDCKKEWIEELKMEI